MGGGLENDEVEQRWDPKNDVEKDRAEEFREHDLPVTHWRRHQRLDRAELKFLGEQAHGDERKNENEREPEKNGVKERFLDRVRHRALVHEGNLEIKIDPADDQEKNENDVGDGRVEVTRIREKDEKFLIAISPRRNFD